MYFFIVKILEILIEIFLFNSKIQKYIIQYFFFKNYFLKIHLFNLKILKTFYGKMENW